MHKNNIGAEGVAAIKVCEAADDLLEAAALALECLSGYEDVEDGDNGAPSPNKAMRAAGMLREAIAKAGS